MGEIFYSNDINVSVFGAKIEREPLEMMIMMMMKSKGKKKN